MAPLPPEAASLLRSRGAVRAFLAFGVVMWAVSCVCYMIADRPVTADWMQAGAVVGSIDGLSWLGATAAAVAAAWLFPVRGERAVRDLARLAAAILAIFLSRVGWVWAAMIAIGGDMPPLRTQVLAFLPSHFLSLSIFAGAGYALRYGVAEREGRLAVARLQGEVARERLRAAAARLRPGVLFRNLDTAGALLGADAPRAEELLSLTAQMLRATFRHGAAAEGTLADEVSFTMLFLEGERVRGGGAIRFSATLEPAARAIPVPRLAVFSLVEAALACAGADEGQVPASVHLRATRENGGVRVVVRDDGALPLERRRANPEWASVDALAAELRALGAGYGLHFADVPQGGVQAELMVPAREAA